MKLGRFIFGPMQTGWTLLNFSSFYGDIPTIKYLLAKAASATAAALPDADGFDGEVPLSDEAPAPDEIQGDDAPPPDEAAYGGDMPDQDGDFRG